MSFMEGNLHKRVEQIEMANKLLRKSEAAKIERINNLEIQLAATIDFATQVKIDCDKRDELIRDLLSGFVCGAADICAYCTVDNDEDCEIWKRVKALGIEVRE